MIPISNTRSIFVALMLPCIALAGDWRDPNAKFSTKNLPVNRLAITWLVTKDVQATCEAQSKQRGLGGFGYGVDACSFWTATSCTIVTSTEPTMHFLGHELRHCFFHDFH